MSLLKDALHFDKFLTPCIIKWVYYVTAALAVIAGFITFITGLFSSGGVVMALCGLVYMVLGPAMARISAEIMILMFRGYDKLCEISANTGGQAGGSCGTGATSTASPDSCCCSGSNE